MWSARSGRPWARTISAVCAGWPSGVVLVFDGDDAGQSAADRSLELFLGNELDLRVLTLPADLDPCDFLLKQGADAFRSLVERAPDPLAYLLDRAAARFDLNSGEGSRLAAEWVVGILNTRAADPSTRTRGQAGQGAGQARSPAPCSAGDAQSHVGSSCGARAGPQGRPARRDQDRVGRAPEVAADPARRTTRPDRSGADPDRR